MTPLEAQVHEAIGSRRAAVQGETPDARDPLDAIMAIDEALGRLLKVADDLRTLGRDTYDEVSAGLEAVAKLVSAYPDRATPSTPAGERELQRLAIFAEFRRRPGVSMMADDMADEIIRLRAALRAAPAGEEVK